MKRIALIAVLALGVGIVSVQAKQTEKQSESKIVSDQENSKHVLVYGSENKSAVNVKIYNEDSKMVYREKITGGSFIRPYNFQDLEYGNYTLILNNGEESFSHNIAHLSQEKHLEVDLKTIGDSKYELLVRGVDQPVNVVLTDKYGKILYSKTEFLKKDFNRIFDLSKIKSDQIQFRVEKGSQKVTKSI